MSEPGKAGQVTCRYYDFVSDLKRRDRKHRVIRGVLLAATYIAVSLIAAYFFWIPGLFLAWIVITSGLVPKVVVPTPDEYCILDDQIVYRGRRLRIDDKLKVLINRERNLISIKSKWMTIINLYAHDPDALYRTLKRIGLQAD